MLVLTRRLNETLFIDDDITLTVLGIKGNQVRIGIKAPDSVRIQREEIYHAVKNGNKALGLGNNKHKDRVKSFVPLKECTSLQIPEEGNN